MTAQEPSIQESLKKDHIGFQEILSDDELAALFAKLDGGANMETRGQGQTNLPRPSTWLDARRPPGWTPSRS